MSHPHFPVAPECFLKYGPCLSHCIVDFFIVYKLVVIQYLVMVCNRPIVEANCDLDDSPMAEMHIWTVLISAHALKVSTIISFLELPCMVLHVHVSSCQ